MSDPQWAWVGPARSTPYASTPPRPTEPEPFTIYDVLARLVAQAQWQTEAEKLDAQEAVRRAEAFQLFGQRAELIARDKGATQ